MAFTASCASSQSLQVGISKWSWCCLPDARLYEQVGVVAMCECSPASSRGVTTMLGCAGCGDQSGGGARDMGCKCLLEVPQLSSVGLEVGSNLF